MRFSGRILLLAICLLGGGLVFAQDHPRHSPSHFGRGGFGHDGSNAWFFASNSTNSTNNARWSPTEFLRDLLAMNPEEREKAINARLEKDRKFTEMRLNDNPDLSPEEREKKVVEKLEGFRKFWYSKLKEYEALKPEEREIRLQTTQRTMQLRFYLKPLLTMSVDERKARLQGLPESDRKLVEERLNAWDHLSPEFQNEVLDNEMVMQYLTRVESLPPAQRNEVLQQYSEGHRARIEQGLARWNALPPEQRQRTYDNFQKFFQLSDREKDKILDTLSDDERKQMEKSLQAFEKLPPDQRRICIDSFRKFSNLTPQQREEFLKNAERWKQMSPGDRETWRNLVTQLPPLPPGLGVPMPPLPPPFPTEIAPPVPAPPRFPMLTNK